MTALSVLQRLINRPLSRQLADWGLGRYAHRRYRKLDRLETAYTQFQTLMRLVRRARQTTFGKEHGFEKIRTIADYQQRVPLRNYESFWSRYWSPCFPHLQGTTWPDPIPYLALSSGTTSGTTKYIPISHQMLASNRKAALTTLCLFLDAYPHTPLLTGRFFFLGGSTDLKDLSTQEKVPLPQKGDVKRSSVQLSLRSALLGPLRSFLAPGPSPASLRSGLAGDLSGISAREVSSLIRPFTFPPLEVALLTDWERKMTLLAEQSAQLPITMLSGVPSWILVLFERLTQVTGKKHIADIWPMFQLVIHGGTSFEPYRSLFERAIGNPGVHFLETYPASEGFIATEDPRYHRLRLIPDHGIFFEFVPRDELDRDQPTRHTIAEVEVGVQYAVVVTTCAGLWSYVLGDTICFEQRDPPLLRFTGRTQYFLSAFGEHLISEEVERAIAHAAEATGAAVTDFHVGPLFPETNATPGRHCYLVEFAQVPSAAEGEPALGRFARELDQQLCVINEDYQAHRQGDLTMLAPQVHAVRHGGFSEWMRSKGKLGGQHKVPRMDNSGTITQELLTYFGQQEQAVN